MSEQDPAGRGTPPGTAPSPAADSSSWRTEMPWTHSAPPPSPPEPPPASEPTPPAAGRRRRRPAALLAGTLVVALLGGGIGGVVGYQAATVGPTTSVLAGGGAPQENESAPAGSIEAVAQTVLPSVVQLAGGTGEGSGIVISRDGLILTNAHVVAGATRGSPLGGPSGPLTAQFQDGTTATAEVVGTDATADLAVVRAQGVSDLAPVELGDSSQVDVGEQVVAVGSPLGLSGTVTSGIVSALERPVRAGGAESGQASVLDAIQTDAAINPGNSGGALTDMQGRVIGITTAIASLGGGGDTQRGSIGLGFAIPIDQAARIGNELATQGFADQAVLGATVGPADPVGATLGALTPGGAAQAAGLAPGDVVLRVNDRAIGSADALVAAVRSEAPGAAVTLTVSTGGAAPREVLVNLGTERAPSG